MHYQPHPGRSRGGAGSSAWHSPSEDLVLARKSCLKGGPACGKAGMTNSMQDRGLKEQSQSLKREEIIS